MSLTITSLQANGLDFAALEHPDADTAAPLALLVHGFPDTAYSFEAFFEPLMQRGLRPVAIFQRGYGPTATPADGDYRGITLGRDVIGLIDALGASEAMLVGHDWGAVTCQVATAISPERISCLVSLSIPHVRRFLLHPTPGQLYRSRYMAKFQLPWAEQRLLRDGQAGLKNLSQSWSPGLDLDLLSPAWDLLSTEEALHGPLGFYRALYAAVLNSDTRNAALGKIEVPTVMLVGADDGCMAPEMFTGQQGYFTKYFRYHVVPDAGHFLPLEAPEAILAAIDEARAAT